MIYLYSYLVVSVVSLGIISWLVYKTPLMNENQQPIIDDRKYYYDGQSYGDMYDEEAPK